MHTFDAVVFDGAVEHHQFIEWVQMGAETEQQMNHDVKNDVRGDIR